MSSEQHLERHEHGPPNEGFDTRAREVVSRFLDQMKSGDVLQFEVMLHRLGVLLVLEEGQVVEAIEQPNPFHPVQETDLHQQWWAEHRRDEEEFSKQFERRETALTCLYVGAVLGYLLRDQLFPSQEETSHKNVPPYRK